MKVMRALWNQNVFHLGHMTQVPAHLVLYEWVLSLWVPEFPSLLPATGNWHFVFFPMISTLLSSSSLNSGDTALKNSVFMSAPKHKLKVTYLITSSETTDLCGFLPSTHFIIATITQAPGVFESYKGWENKASYNFQFISSALTIEHGAWLGSTSVHSGMIWLKLIGLEQRWEDEPWLQSQAAAHSHALCVWSTGSHFGLLPLGPVFYASVHLWGTDSVISVIAKVVVAILFFTLPLF